MSVADIVFLILFFVAFIGAIIWISENKKKLRDKGDDSYHCENDPDFSQHYATNHPHSSSEHDTPDAPETH